MGTSLLVFLLGNGLLALGAAATTVLLRPASTLDAALTFVVVALAEVTLAMLVAGALLERLDRLTVLLLVGAYSAGATALAARQPRPRLPSLPPFGRAITARIHHFLKG